MKDNSSIALGLVLTAGVALIALAKTQLKTSRSVLSWKQNPDGTCTYTYDDGVQEIGSCISPPS